MAIRKIILFMTVLAIGILYSQGSHNLRQLVREWPAGYDTTGQHWMVYNPDNPWIQVLSDTSIGSSTVKPGDFILWTANVGNFPSSPPWAVGDTVVAFGSWDSAYANNPAGYGDNVNHTGFYWLFSDTLTTEEPQTWQPADTLWLMPKPGASIETPTNGVDTIVIRIPNPPETRRGDQTVYDVLGYEIYVAIGSGTPDNFKPIAYVPRIGQPVVDTTIYKDMEDNYPNGSVVYYAYKIVVRKN